MPAGLGLRSNRDIWTDPSESTQAALANDVTSVTKLASLSAFCNRILVPQHPGRAKWTSTDTFTAHHRQEEDAWGGNNPATDTQLSTKTPSTKHYPNRNLKTLSSREPCFLWSLDLWVEIFCVFSWHLGQVLCAEFSRQAAKLTPTPRLSSLGVFSPRDNVTTPLLLVPLGQCWECQVQGIPRLPKSH